MAEWRSRVTETLGGRFQIVATKLAPGGRTVDVTYIRRAPTLILSYSSADPFGDSTCVLKFPSLSPFDDLAASDLSQWLDYYSNIDIYWVPAIDYTMPYFGIDTPMINPLTQQVDIIAPIYLRDGSGAVIRDNRTKVWEGYIASMDFSSDQSNFGVEVQCQGALFQIDRYLQKPFYPVQPWPLESLIADSFDHVRKPHLRTQPLKIQWPVGWTKTVPQASARNTYTVVGEPGQNYTGYAGRQTGAWDHTLTSFVQNNLAVMLTDAESGVTPGNQWTVQQERQSATSAGRQPVLTVRDRFRTPDFSVQLGDYGVTVSLNGDSTQSENIIYGDGTDVDGTVWRNAVIANDGSRTDYLPLAYGQDVYPSVNNAAFQSGGFVSEAYTKYDSGFSQIAAISSAKQALARDRQPGFTGTITLNVDPQEMPRWLIRAGMTLLLKGFLGSGERGMPFHVSAASNSPEDGTVTLTVDTRYRDLLTVEEAQARTRDPLTPVKMLQVNKTSVLIEDIQAPWDYSAGSGYIPKDCTQFYAYLAANTPFPYDDWHQKHPPLMYPSWYVRCAADAQYSRDRWVGPVPILTSEKGTISRTEIYVVNIYGERVACPFHVSFYYVNVTVDAMPRSPGNYSPFQDGAFESINPQTGQPWPDGSFLAPDPSMIVGWGNKAGGVLNRCGFWPGSETQGTVATGMFVDNSNWSYDNTTNPNYAPYAPAGQEPASAITIYAMFYADWTEPVYFQGRLYRQNPGTN